MARLRVVGGKREGAGQKEKDVLALDEFAKTKLTPVEYAEYLRYKEFLRTRKRAEDMLEILTGYIYNRSGE